MLLPIARDTVVLAPGDLDIARRLRDEHAAVRPAVENVRAVADALVSHDHNLAPARRLLIHLQTEVLPHERAEHDLLYPAIARALGGSDPVGAMSRSHAEIEHQIGRLRRLLDGIGDQVLEPEDVVELCRLLYGLYAVLRLHNTQEDEWAFSLLPDTRALATTRTPPPVQDAATRGAPI